MQLLSLKFFGEVKLRRDTGPDVALPRKTQWLLAYLASNAGEGHVRDKLAGLLWADRGDEQARHSLRQCLFTLSKAIDDDGPPLIRADRHRVALNAEAVEVDVWEFERLIALDTPDALQQAVALYSGDFLANQSIEDEVLDAWCAAERVRLRDRCYETLAKLTSYYTDTVNLDDAIEAGRRLIGLDPLREDGHRIVMRLYSRAGRRAEAIKQYRLCLETLRRELNVQPEEATTKLYAEIRGKPDEGDQPANMAPGLSEKPLAADDHTGNLRKSIVGLGSKALAAGLGLVFGLVVVILWLSIT